MQYNLAFEKWGRFAGTDIENFTLCTKKIKREGIEMSVFGLLYLKIQWAKQKLVIRDHEFGKQSWDEEYLFTVDCFVLFDYTFYYVHLFVNSQNLTRGETN